MRICAIEDITPGTARGFMVPTPQGELALLIHRSADRIHAYRNRCPHTGVNLDWNPDQFMNLEGTHLQCATHGALFRVTDGFCVFGPCAGKVLEPVAVSVQSGQIVLVEEAATRSPA